MRVGETRSCTSNCGEESSEREDQQEHDEDAEELVVDVVVIPAADHSNDLAEEIGHRESGDWP